MAEIQEIMEGKNLRLKEIREALNLTQEEFAQMIMSDKSNIGKMERGKQPIGKNVEYKILNTFRVINSFWWETGEGEMFKEDESIQKIGIQTQKNSDGTQQQQILFGPRQVIRYVPEELVKVPLLSISARAGFVENLDNYTEYVTEHTYVLPAPGEKYENALAIRIDGDSMEPRLERGDVVLAFVQESSEWEYLNPGIYAMVYRNSFVIKRIKKNTLQQLGQIELHSDNEMHGTISVRREDIRAVWKVTRLVERRLH